MARQSLQIATEYYDREDKQANTLAAAEVQCDWLRQIGFRNVVCYFKILELAVFDGLKITWYGTNGFGEWEIPSGRIRMALSKRYRPQETELRLQARWRLSDIYKFERPGRRPRVRHRHPSCNRVRKTPHGPRLFLQPCRLHGSLLANERAAGVFTRWDMTTTVSQRNGWWKKRLGTSASGSRPPGIYRTMSVPR